MTDIGSRAGVGKAPPLHRGQICFSSRSRPRMGVLTDGTNGSQAGPSSRIPCRPWALPCRKEYSAGTLGAAPTTVLCRSPGDGLEAIATSAPREEKPGARDLFLVHSEMCVCSGSEAEWLLSCLGSRSWATKRSPLVNINVWSRPGGYARDDAGTVSVPIEVRTQGEF